jgi:chromosome segregation ATPase
MYGAIGYSSAIAAEPSLITRPFLLLWEQGFHGLTPFPWSMLGFLTFSHVAIVDVAVLLAVLLLTWQIHTEVNVRQATREQRARTVERKLRQIAWSAALVFAGRTSPRANDDRSRQVLEALLDELRAERERGATIADRREREAADLRTFGSEFRVGAQDLRRVTAEVRETFDAMLNVTSNLEDRLADLSRDEGEVRAGIAEMTGGLEKYYETQRSASAEVASAARALAEAADRALGSGAAMAAAVQGLEGSIADLSVKNQLAADSQVEAARLGRDTLQHSSGVMAELQRATHDMSGVIQALGNVAPTMLAAAEHESASASEMIAAIGKLVAVQASVSSGMSDSIQRLTDVTVELRDGIRDLTASLADAKLDHRRKRRFWIFPHRPSNGKASTAGTGNGLVHSSG